MTGVATEVLGGLHVSRETIESLQAFCTLVQRWNPAINLVSKTTLPVIWNRHIVDSAQLFSQCPDDAKLWVDLGSGGGFPGIVIAILARELKPELEVTMVESDLRKATFLREACRTLALKAEISSARIESLPEAKADVLSARALASLDALLGYAARHLRPDGVALFPKGETFEAEIEAARKTWFFTCKALPSLSDTKAAILHIRDIRRA